MPRLDGISQYENRITKVGKGTRPAEAGSTEPTRQGGTALAKGTVFEGVATRMKDGYVTLSLNNGQSMRARMASGVSVRLGEPVLFEVQSNQDNQITIKQVPVASEYNPTLQKALTAAGLSLTEQNIHMVDMMMRNQMPIDKNSLLAMARTVQAHPQANLETLVQMRKLDFPITEMSLQQFEAYKGGDHALVTQLSQIMEQLPSLLGETGLSEGALFDLQNRILGALELAPRDSVQGQVPAGQEGQEAAGTMGADGMEGADALAGAGQVSDKEMGPGADGITVKAALAGEAQASDALPGLKVDGIQVKGGQGQPDQVNGEPGGKGSIISDGTQESAGRAGSPVQGDTAAPGGVQAGAFLSEAGWNSLEQQLLEITGMQEDARMFPEGALNRNLGAGELLRAIQEHLGQLGGENSQAFQKLFRGREYQGLLRQAMMEQWLLEPGQVESRENMDRLYARMNRQMAHLEQLMQNMGKGMSPLGREVAQVRGNLEMMQQMNQLFNYVQIPLKLQGQNAHSDLYVYTNKKKLLDKEGELSALLHLELDHLGTTDVQIKMLGSKVNTHFYLADDVSLQLVEQHIESLTRRLQDKGYQCSIKVQKQENQEQKTDVVMDFLTREAPVGKLQRYSFDVKA